MRKILAPVCAILLGLAMLATFSTPPASAQLNNNVNIVGYTATTDPCQNPTVPKSSVAIAVTSSTTTQLVALTTGQAIYVCGGEMSLTGTTPTALFEYGTSTDCTGTHALTGAVQPTSGSMIPFGSGSGVQFKTAVSNGLCLVTGGTTTFAEGWMVYVKQ